MNLLEGTLVLILYWFYVAISNFIVAYLALLPSIMLKAGILFLMLSILALYLKLPILVVQLIFALASTFFWLPYLYTILNKIEKKGFAAGLSLAFVRLLLAISPFVVAFLYKKFNGFEGLLFLTLPLLPILFTKLNLTFEKTDHRLNLRKQLFNVLLGVFDAITYAFPLLVIWKYGPFTIIILGYLTTFSYIISSIFSLILGKLIDKRFNTIEKQRYLAAFILIAEALTIVSLLLFPLSLPEFSLLFAFYLFLVGQMFTIFTAFQAYLGLTDIGSLAGRGVLMSIGEIIMLTFLFVLALFG